MWYVSPTDEEIFKVILPFQLLIPHLCFVFLGTNLITSSFHLAKKYNPELQKRSLENRQERKEEYVNFLLKLKELSQSDRSSNAFPIFLIGLYVASLPLITSDPQHISRRTSLQLDRTTNSMGRS